uniref:Kinesin-like protein Kif23 Arf6-interacting domain-containing protein n=1 Tax=Ditylenchus dipsaci TaxID=166011 RepID=A0A915E6P6_9BILA
MPEMPKIEFFDPPPPIQLNGPDDSESISKLRDYYSHRLAKHRGHLATINTNASLLQNKITQRLCIADLDRARVQELEVDADELNSYNATTNAKLTQAQREINALKQRLYRYENTEQNGRRRDEEARAREREMQVAAEQQRMKLQKVVEIFESPVPSTSRVATLRKQFVSTENLDVENSTPKMSSRQFAKQRGPPGSAQPQSSVHSQQPTPQSRSLRTLNHQAVNKIPTGTLLQPQFAKNTKHTTKVEASDLQKYHEYVTSKQKVDEYGNLSTEYLKGEIVPTAGGGSAVMFRDVEKLCQESPKQLELHDYR